MGHLLSCRRPSGGCRAALLEEEEADGAGEEHKAADEKSNADREEGSSGRRVRHDDWRRRFHSKTTQATPARTKEEFNQKSLAPPTAIASTAAATISAAVAFFLLSWNFFLTSLFFQIHSLFKLYFTSMYNSLCFIFRLLFYYGPVAFVGDLIFSPKFYANFLSMINYFWRLSKGDYH